MAKLIYSGIMSLDGYIADADGRFDWSAPDEEVHAFVNELQRQVGTYLLGRRMYEVLSAWETMPTGAGQPAVTRDFAELWRSADKIVYSRTLERVSTAKTRLERDFDPDMVGWLKATADRDLTVGGPGLATHAMRAGLVDEYHMFLTPIVVGGGISFLPDGVRFTLDLNDVHTFGNGVVHLRYRDVSNPRVG